MSKRSLILLIVVSLAVLVTGPLHAAKKDWEQVRESRILSDRWSIALGGFAADFKTDVQIGSPTILGTLIRFEDTLNLEPDITTFRLDGFYRVAQKHAIGFNFMLLNREGGGVLDEEIEFNGETYVAQAAMRTQFDNQMFRVDYKYSFINDGKVDAGVLAGLATFKFDLALEGEGRIGDPNNPSIGFVKEDTKVLAPVPVVGLFINYAVTKKVIFRADAAFINLDIGDIEGKVNDAKATIEYYFIKNFGIGGGFSNTDIRYEQVKDNGSSISVEYRYSGLLGYVNIVF